MSPASTRSESDRPASLAVIILTLNESSNIGECLDTLEWVEEVILVDSGSTDETVELAQQARPKLQVLENSFVDFGQQRNWALDQAQTPCEWVLFLDADERSTPEFANAVSEAIRSSGDKVGFFLCYRNFFLGRWIRHATLFPTWQLRLLKKGRVHFAKEGHGQREIADGALGYIEEPYEHHGFSKGVHEWISRHNRYSTWEVELIQRLREEDLKAIELTSTDPVVRRRALKRLAARSSWRPLNRFLYLYIWRRGFLDGKPGLIYCLLRAAHEIHIVAKLAERMATSAEEGS